MASLGANATYIAFDFGTKKIGVAVGQTITLSANALDNLMASNGVPNWSEVQHLIDEWRPVGFVVGIPINMDGSEQGVTQKARQFANALKEQTQLPVYEVDERLTTVEAKQRLFDLGGAKALKTMSIDGFAAKLILESWLSNKVDD